MPKPIDQPFEFEKALKELEDITAWFESPEANLDQGLAKFERGMELAALLKTHLETVENRVEKIKQRFTPAAGNNNSNGATTEPTDDQPLGLF